ncbi:MAG: phosphonopyruvate decarboxylase, partial [Clostridia bacterium]|nr:phosphonopyruvate decarboxylase [Clostridia bacterium]
QHIYQGEVTLKLLEDMEIEYFVVDKNTSVSQIEEKLSQWQSLLAEGKQVAFVIKKGALQYDEKVAYTNSYSLCREEIIRHIVSVSGDDPIISTTGKASRELFEIREANGQGHERDFLTVGSMGHSSSIALGVALNKPNAKVWCVDGDGAALMHMGAMAVIGANKPKNLAHIVINNGAHETVGGMPTVSQSLELTKIATACGYPYAVKVSTYEDLDRELKKAKASDSLSFIEVESSISSRADLGRPTTTALDNKNSFVEFLKKI